MGTPASPTGISVDRPQTGEVMGPCSCAFNYTNQTTPIDVKRLRDSTMDRKSPGLTDR